MATAQKIHSCKPLQAPQKAKLAREYFFYHPRRIFSSPIFFVFSHHRTDLVLNQTNRSSNIDFFVDNVCKLDTSQPRTDSRASGNKVLPKAGVTSFYDTFVLNLTLVF